MYLYHSLEQWPPVYRVGKLLWIYAVHSLSNSDYFLTVIYTDYNFRLKMSLKIKESNVKHNLISVYIKCFIPLLMLRLHYLDLQRGLNSGLIEE